MACLHDIDLWKENNFESIFFFAFITVPPQLNQPCASSLVTSSLHNSFFLNLADCPQVISVSGRKLYFHLSSIIFCFYWNFHLAASKYPLFVPFFLLFPIQRYEFTLLLWEFFGFLWLAMSKNSSSDHFAKRIMKCSRNVNHKRLLSQFSTRKR